MLLFAYTADYKAFESALEESLEKLKMRLCAYCLMPNHWHLVLWPRHDGDLGKFMHRLTSTHVRRWQYYRNVVGKGHLYKGRYRSFPIGPDEHFFNVMRYVERNALTAHLVPRAEAWKWSSLWRRFHGGHRANLLYDWLEELPRNWVQLVNMPLTDAELAAVRTCIRTGAPYGNIMRDHVL